LGIYTGIHQLNQQSREVIDENICRRKVDYRSY
jgi:hypothetical protein